MPAKRVLSLVLSPWSVFLTLSTRTATAQVIPEERPKWHANWITHPNAPLREPEVVHFRKLFHLDAIPASFPVLVSADNRFLLFVNGKRVADGPARGDFSHWRYERYDLAPFLQAGENCVAATVWQFGIYAPLAQISDRLAFLIEGESEAESIINSDTQWQVEEEKGHSFKTPLPKGLWQYFAAGPGERVDFHQYDQSWNQLTGTSGNWVQAGLALREVVFPSENIPSVPSTGNAQRWLLYPDPLPQMEYKQIAAPKIVRTVGPTSKSAAGVLAVVPPNSKTNLLLDQGFVVSAYPEVVVSGGNGSRIQAVYAESLYGRDQKRGYRAEVGELRALGVTDEILPDGGPERSFSPLCWRTWRFLELQVETSGEPLQIETVRTFFTGYPFEDRGAFSASDSELSRIREICWRTARVDAHETYMDTAYWEQLQYFGDTRVQMLISYVVSGDDRLARQALQAANDSILPEGLTQSRYPSSLVQIIPPFSLFYVNSLHDYWMYRPDPAFVKELLPGTRSILAWFSRHQRPDGFLTHLPYWNFVDWLADGQEFPPLDHQGRSSILTLQYIGALQDAAEMEERLGDPALATTYRRQAQSAAENVYRLCWNQTYRLLADTPEQNTFSEHANALAVLYDVVPKAEQAAVLRRMLDSRAAKAASLPKLTPASYYFEFYVSRALDHAGLGDLYIETLHPWREMLAKGLTTTPETPDPSRSDTHAWSGHPAYDFNTIIAGVHPGAPGFATVRIEPSLGNLSSIDATTPHPSGSIRTSFRRGGDKVEATIELPVGITGSLIWKGKVQTLHAGVQHIILD